MRKYIGTFYNLKILIPTKPTELQGKNLVIKKIKIKIYRILIPQDGNCFFRSILILIGEKQERHMELRKELVKFVQENESIYKDYLYDENLLNQISQEGSFVNTFFCSPVSNMLGINIWIVTENVRTFIEKYIVNEEKQNIVLEMVNNNHYNAIICEQSTLRNLNLKQVIPSSNNISNKRCPIYLNLLNKKSIKFWKLEFKSKHS